MSSNLIFSTSGKVQFQKALLRINLKSSVSFNPAGNYMFKVKNRNSSKKCEICSKLTIRRWRRSGGFIVNFGHKLHRRRSGVFTNFEHTSHLLLVFLLMTLNM